MSGNSRDRDGVPYGEVGWDANWVAVPVGDKAEQRGRDETALAITQECEICQAPDLVPFAAEPHEPAGQGMRWLSLPAAPASVRHARRFALDVLENLAETDREHVDDVVLVVSELITNSVREVARIAGESVRLGVATGPRWTHLYAVDTAPTLPEHTDRGLLAGSGRGIPIINSLAAMTWIDQGERDKTIHVVLTRTGVVLTPQERQVLQGLNP
jgi:Histidine kinase-like ATPase domain